MTDLVPTVVTLHLTRPGMWELLAGGLDRMSFSLAPPVRHGFVERDPFADDLEATCVRWDWTSASGLLSCRVLRKLGSEALDLALWEAMKRSAFPGIDQDRWMDNLHADPPGAVSADEWTGTSDVLMSTAPFPGAVLWPITITGPWTEHAVRSRGGEQPSEGTAPKLAWLMPPMFHAHDADRSSDPIDEMAARRRPYWSHPYIRTTRLLVDLPDLVDHLPEPISRKLALAAATATGKPCPDPEWNAVVDLWIAPAAEGDRR